MILGAVVLITIIAVSAAGTVDLLEAACIGVFVLLFAKSITMHEAFYCIKPRVLLTIVASFGIGKSLGYSGLASWIAGGLVSFTAPMGTSFRVDGHRVKSLTGVCSRCSVSCGCVRGQVRTGCCGASASARRAWAALLAATPSSCSCSPFALRYVCAARSWRYLGDC